MKRGLFVILNISLSRYFRTEIIEEQKELEREVAALGETLVNIKY